MTTIRRALALLLIWMMPGLAAGHALDPGYLDLRALEGDKWQVFWRIPDVRGRPMAIAPRLPETCSAPAAPAPAQSDGRAWIASWIVTCAGGLAGRELTIDGLARQRTDVLVRFAPLGDAAQSFRLTPQAPGLTVPATPTLLGVLGTYLGLGFEHILEGWDHLLFVFCLLLLIGNRWRLLGAITAFTLAHSITLALASLELVHLPGPPVEAIIALSIVFLATEALAKGPQEARLSVRAPWVIAFCFGLLHGMGFAGALSEIGLPQGDIVAALLGFNLGVELGQIAFVLVLLGVAWLGRPLLRAVRLNPLWLRTGLAYGAGGVATFWLVERVSAF